MDDAYNLLKKMKHKDESFSEIIRKLASKNTVDLTKWLGIINGGEERAGEFKKTTKEIRKRLSRSVEIRLKKVQ